MADITLNWLAAMGATGYKVYMSTDLGVTWTTPIDVGNVITYVYKNVVEDKKVLFKLAAYNTQGDAIINWAGAWCDLRNRPPIFPSNLGIA